MTKKRVKVFVSYSRHDEELVKPLAALLGLNAEDAVFLDVEQLKPGMLWEETIVKAIEQCSVFVICWCCESKKSTFVAKELKLALADRKKKIVPVLFCSAKLPRQVAKRQWIDLRGRIAHTCSASDPHLLTKLKTPPGDSLRRRLEIARHRNITADSARSRIPPGGEVYLLVRSDGELMESMTRDEEEALWLSEKISTYFQNLGE